MRKAAVAWWALGVGLVLSSCSSSIQEPAAAPSKKPQSEAASPKVPPGSLARKDVVRVADAGVGTFLQKVEVEYSVKDGKFEGFRIVSLQPENFWRSVDLQPGDVVVGVNGKSIETEIAAFDALESLRTAPELRVHLLRDGSARELVFPIVGPPEPKVEPARAGSGVSKPQAAGDAG